MKNIEEMKNSDIRKSNFFIDVESWKDKNFNKNLFLSKYSDLFVDIDCIKIFLEIDFFSVYNFIDKKLFENNDFLSSIIDYLFINNRKFNSDYETRVLSEIFHYGDKNYLEESYVIERISKINLPFAINKYGDKIYNEEVVEYFLINKAVTSLDYVPLFLLKESERIRHLVVGKSLEIPYEKLEFTNEGIIDEILKTNENSFNMIKLLKLLNSKSLSLDTSKEIVEVYTEKVSEEIEKELQGTMGLETYMTVLSMAQGWKKFLSCISEKSQFVENIIFKNPALEKINSTYYNDEKTILKTGRDSLVDVMSKLNDNVEILSTSLEKNILKDNIVKSNLKKRVNKY